MGGLGLGMIQGEHGRFVLVVLVVLVAKNNHFLFQSFLIQKNLE